MALSTSKLKGRGATSRKMLLFTWKLGPSAQCISIYLMKISKNHPPRTRVGVVGTGFIALGLCRLLQTTKDLVVSRVLTRRDLQAIEGDITPTQSLDELLDHSDIILECSGDIFHATKVVDAAMKRKMPVVTMASEFHATVGSYFVDKGIISEAQGDQPGSLAALHEEAEEMGFRPLVYANIKGFQNHHPTVKDMKYWSGVNGISLQQVTSFTDGTKLQIEQVLVANGLGASIANQGMSGLRDMSLDTAGPILGQIAKRLGSPIADYIINPALPAGVFLVCEHPTERSDVLRYLKLGSGPFHTLLRPYHLCHLEVPRTIRRILAGQPPLLNNSATPKAGVIPIAKCKLSAGHVIPMAIGGSDLRGEAAPLSEFPDCPPLGLLTGARLRNSVEQGQILQLSDVDIPESLAKEAWESIRSRSAIT